MITLENGSAQHPCAVATSSDLFGSDSAGGGQTCIPNPFYPKFPENEVVAADSAFVDNTAERTMDACVSNCALVATVSSRF